MRRARWTRASSRRRLQLREEIEQLKREKRAEMEVKQKEVMEREVEVEGVVDGIGTLGKRNLRT